MSHKKAQALLKSEPERHLTCVASISGLNKPLQDLVKKILAEYSIWSVSEGSVLYGVVVLRSDASAASKILSIDPRLLGFKITVFEPEVEGWPVSGLIDAEQFREVMERYPKEKKPLEAQ